MKRILTLISALFLALAAFAQTPEEIVAKMEETMGQQNKETNFRVAMDLKYPLVGTATSKIHRRGDKLRYEMIIKGNSGIFFFDGDTEWQYDSEENKVEILRSAPGEKSTGKQLLKVYGNTDDLFDFKDIVDGYDISLEKETATAWYLHCVKKKDNKEKEAPKTVDFVVAKGSYYLVSYSTIMRGSTLKVYDIGFNVTEKQVTFNPADYPGVTIIDKR